jgi:hypothetical protein
VDLLSIVLWTFLGLLGLILLLYLLTGFAYVLAGILWIFAGVVKALTALGDLLTGRSRRP